MKFYMPTIGAGDWKRGLAKPTHWKIGNSAYAMAHAWEDAAGFPKSVKQVLESTIFVDCVPIVAFPEHTTAIPKSGSGKHPQNDVFILAKLTDGQLATIVVEGKVTEDFDKTLAEWFLSTKEPDRRLSTYLHYIGLSREGIDYIRYQLIQRTAAAIYEARQYNAKYALMLVHSFSQSDEHFEDYEAFVKLYGIPSIVVGQMAKLITVHDIDLYTAWVRGDARYLQAQEI